MKGLDQSYATQPNPRDHLFGSWLIWERTWVKLLFWVLILAPLFVSLDVSSVWDANEAFYVQTPREMVESGDWVFPTFNGQPRVNKPPLSYWLVAAAYEFFGVDLLWERLIMALLGVLSILSVYRIGRLLFHEAATALLAAGIFATAFRFLIISRRLLIDSLVLCLVLAAIMFFISWLARARRFDFFCCALCFGLGVLAKGPVALIPVPILLAVLLLTGQWRRLRIGELITAGLLFAAVSASWFLLLGWQRGWQPVFDFFFTENIGRYVSTEFGPRRSIHYYVGVFLGDFFPWSLLFPAAATWAIRLLKKGREELSRHQGLLLLLLWFAFYFLLFSFSRNKQEYYILPLYPAAALLLAVWIRAAGIPRWLRVAGAILLFVSAGGITIMAVAIFPGLLFNWLPSVFLLLAAAALLRQRLGFVVLALALFFSSALGIFSAPMEAYKPVRHLATLLQERFAEPAGEEIKVGYYRLTAPSLRFYVDRNIVETYDLNTAVALLAAPGPAYLLTDAEGLEDLRGSLAAKLEIEATRPKLYTTARTVLARFRTPEQAQASGWTRPVYLVSNVGQGRLEIIDGDRGATPPD